MAYQVKEYFFPTSESLALFASARHSLIDK